MISCTKAILIALYCAALAASVSGRESVADENPLIGGAGNGSEGREDKAVSETSPNVALVSADYASSTVVIFKDNDEKEDEKDNDKDDKNNDKDDKNNDKDDKNNDKDDKNNDKDDKNNDKDNDKNNDKDEDKNNDKDNDKNNDKDEDNDSGTDGFGDHGTLADREVDVLCHICDAVKDHSYFANVKVDVGGDNWSCGYLQETVQDVNPFSDYKEERLGCRNAQQVAEWGGCCAETMYVDTPGKDLNDPCDLCQGGGAVPKDKYEKLVNTGVVGRHTCGSIEGVMKEGIFSAKMCPDIIDAVGQDCCTQDSGWDFGWGWASQRSGTQKLSLLRGSVP